MSDKILVTGAAGLVGSAVVDNLLAAGADVRAGARNPSRLRLPAEVETVALDLTVPDTLAPALQGVRQVFLYAVPAGAESFAAAAMAAGIEHVVLLSSHSPLEVAEIPERKPIADIHTTVEQALGDAGVPTTFLRPAHFASNVLLWGWHHMVKSDGVVRFPYAESHCDAVHERDIGAVGAKALLEPGHVGKSYFITGPESITQRRQAELIGEAIGRPVRFEEMTEQQARESHVPLIPEWVVEATFSYWAASDGKPAEITDVVPSLLGRPALSFAQWAADHVADFT